MSDPADKLRRREDQQAEADAAPAVPAPVPGPPAATLARLIASSAQFDLLFLDPRRHLTLLDEFYVDGPGTLDRCLPIHRVMAATSVAVILTRIRDLGVVTTELLPRCGFSRLSRILVMDQDGAGDISGAKVFVTAQRGGAELTLPYGGVWRAPPRGTNPIKIAEQLYPNAKHRLHAFAESHRPRWTTLVSANTWIEIPTLR
jgi:hypothetical protein